MNGFPLWSKAVDVHGITTTVSCLASLSDDTAYSLGKVVAILDGYVGMPIDDRPCLISRRKLKFLVALITQWPYKLQRCGA